VPWSKTVLSATSNPREVVSPPASTRNQLPTQSLTITSWPMRASESSKPGPALAFIIATTSPPASVMLLTSLAESIAVVIFDRFLSHPTRPLSLGFGGNCPPQKTLEFVMARYYVLHSSPGDLSSFVHVVNDFFENWTVQVRKGLLELCILNALADKERYGYELVKTLVAIPGLGVTEGTLYPLLSRLRVQELITARLEESSEGPARKYYALTREGRKIMATMNDYLETLQQGALKLQKGA